MDTKTFHIKIIFEVVETFLNGIFVPVYLKGFCVIFDMVAHKHEPSDVVPFMSVDGLFVVIYPYAPYWRFMDQKKTVVIRAMFLHMFAGEQFFIAAVQGVVKIPFVHSCFETVIVDVDIETVAFPLGRFRGRIQFVPIDHAVIMVGADAVPVSFYRFAGQICGKRHTYKKFFYLCGRTWQGRKRGVRYSKHKNRRQSHESALHSRDNR